jgi:hypothetical protein
VAVFAIAASALMALGAGVIWSMTHVVAGGVLFHAGLIAWLVLGYADGMGTRATLADLGTCLVARQRRRTTGTATSLRRNGGSVQGGS